MKLYHFRLWHLPPAKHTISGCGGGGALAKNLWRGCVATLTHSTHFHLMTPFWIIYNQLSTISHRITLFFGMSKIFIFFFLIEFFVQNVSKFVFCPQIYQNLSNLPRLTPIFWIFSLNDPFFSEENLSPKDPYFRVAVRAPRHFQGWVPLSLPVSYCFYQLLVFKFVFCFRFQLWCHNNATCDRKKVGL